MHFFRCLLTLYYALVLYSKHSRISQWGENNHLKLGYYASTFPDGKFLKQQCSREELDLFATEGDASQTQSFAQVALTGEELIPKEEKANLTQLGGEVSQTGTLADLVCAACRGRDRAEPC